MDTEDVEGCALRKLQDHLLSLQDDVLKFYGSVNTRINGMLFSIDEVLPVSESKIVGTKKIERGSAFWQVLGLLHSGIQFKSKADLARHVRGDRGKAISRQRVHAILEKIVDEGLADNPFPPNPKMRRDK